jgi:glycosyltransferase involved in cell wall biosynthesis
MAQRLKVLISAYACEPGKGSEPEVGWRWALEMARFHDVVVLTRANNRRAIEQGLELLRGSQPPPRFVYHDEPPFLLDIKKSFRATKLYYIIWQRSAREVISGLHKIHQFDLLHHVTFAAFRYPAAIWGHGVPCVWGPIGGIESVPIGFLPWSHPRSLLLEILRDLHNLVQASPFHTLPGRASASTLILASTRDMRDAFASHGFEAQILPTIGLDPAELPYLPHPTRQTPLKLLFVGNVITLKGVELALHAFARAAADATLTIIGDGDYLPAAKSLAIKLGVQNRVNFVGRLPRQQVLETYRNHDVFLFPSLHDTGGYAVIEAMFNELPVICLDCGGPAITVTDGCGFKIPVKSRGTVIDGLTIAIEIYHRNLKLLEEHGHNARQRVLSDYAWEKRGNHMNDLYQLVCQKQVQDASFTGIGHTATLLHRMFSFKGMAAAIIALLLIGSFGFGSLTLLKRKANQIVTDTLPGLAYAGQANAHLADAYRTLLFITMDDQQRRDQIRSEMAMLSDRTMSYLQKYESSIFSREDRTNFETVVKLRKEYDQTRDKVLALAAAGKRDEAISLFNESLMPKQAEVKRAGDKLLDYNMHQGERRGRDIMTICSGTQLAVAAVGMIIFILGFFIGLSK